MEKPREGRTRFHLWITGRVQGVFFREAARREAQRLGVDGWVRNLPDGRVEAVLEGRPQDVEALHAWCRRGPPDADVAAVDARPEAPQGEAGFRVVR